MNQVHELSMDSARSGESYGHLFAAHNINIVVAAGETIAGLKRIDSACQAHNVKLVACSTVGVCGFVFNDFQRNFVVTDTTGEDAKEVQYTASNKLLYIRC